MNEIIYLEPDEDITGVIARVKETESKAVSLVVPRGGTIAQSIVNLKLLKREIEKLGKTVSLVTKDKISKNLASQVGMAVFGSAQEAKTTAVTDIEPEEKKSPDKADGFSTAGIKVNQYTREAAQEEIEDTDNQPENPVEEEIDTGEDSNNARAGESRPESDEDDEDIEINAHAEAQRTSLAHAKPVEREKKEQLENKEEAKVAKKNISSRRKPAIIILSVLLVILIIAAAVFYPSANVKITLATSNLETSNEITIDKSATSVDLDTLIIPAKEYSQEESAEKTYNSTGKKDVGTKASGEITFYNDYDPNNAITLAAGTQLSASGKLFVLDSGITIPKASIISLYPLKTTPGEVKGKITAKENGDSYNIAAAKFTITSFSGTKQEKVYGQSSATLTGGTTKEINIVSDDDLANAKKAMGEELEIKGKEDLGKQAETDKYKLIASSISKTEGDFMSTKESGEEADTFTAKFSIKLLELGFNEPQLRDCAVKKIESGLKSDEMLVNPEGTDLDYDIKAVDNVKGTAVISSKFAGKVGKKLETSNIQNMLLRAKYGSAEGKIEAMDGVKDASISINPKFWPLLPFLKQRISVSFDYQKE